MDVTDPRSVKAVVGLSDKIDILINNAAKDPKVKKEAGLTPDSRFETMTPAYWFQGVDAAMNGTFFCSQAVSNKMLEKRRRRHIKYIIRLGGYCSRSKTL